ncbi:helix-turn-helix transcriptional regulator [Orbaceae bacterium ac157xtp]
MTNKKHQTTFEELKELMLSTDEARAAYEEAKREWELKELLLDARHHANMKQIDIAKKLNLSSTAIHRIENNPAKASITTLNKYLSACNAKITFNLSFQ